jgi:hypothetical protein
MSDDLLSEAVAKIRGNELKILDDFCKAFISAQCLLTGKDVIGIMGSYVLNQKTTFKDGHIVSQHWLTLKDQDEG